MTDICQPCRLAVLAILLAALAHGYLLVTGQDIDKLAWTWPFLAGLASKYLTGEGANEPV